MTAAAEGAAEAAGIEFIAPPSNMVTTVTDYALADAETVGDLAAAQSGITEADAMVERFLGLVEKWNGIVAETGADAEAIAARVQEEVWDKVDFSTYGL